jgi:hypothetical protein
VLEIILSYSNKLYLLSSDSNIYAYIMGFPRVRNVLSVKSSHGPSLTPNAQVLCMIEREFYCDDCVHGGKEINSEKLKRYR